MIEYIAEGFLFIVLFPYGEPMTDQFEVMRRKGRSIFVRIIMYGILLVIVLSLPPFLVFVSPGKRVTNILPTAYRVEYQDVTLRTRDGAILAGWFIPNKNSSKALVVCHGYPMDKGDIFGVTYTLAKHYNLLYFDFRAMGQSSGRISTVGWREKEDVLAAIRFLKEKGFKDIGAFGFSMGAAAIFMANSPDIKCIVSDSSYAALNDLLPVVFARSGFLRDLITVMAKVWCRLLVGINTDEIAPVKYIAGMRIPILLIHCMQDTVIPVSEAQHLHQVNLRSRLWLIPHGDHGESSLSGEYDKTIIDFFNVNL